MKASKYCFRQQQQQAHPSLHGLNGWHFPQWHECHWVREHTFTLWTDYKSLNIFQKNQSSLLSMKSISMVILYKKSIKTSFIKKQNCHSTTFWKVIISNNRTNKYQCAGICSNQKFKKIRQVAHCYLHDLSVLCVNNLLIQNHQCEYHLWPQSADVLKCWLASVTRKWTCENSGELSLFLSIHIQKNNTYIHNKCKVDHVSNKLDHSILRH